MKRENGWLQKMIGILLCVSLVFTCGGGAFAATEQGDELEKAILAVKSVVDIPEDYQFEYHSYENEVDGEKRKQWELSWYDENYENNIYASVNQEYQMIAFGSYSSEEQSGIGKLSRSDASGIADSFLKKAIPDEADKMQQEKATSYGSGNAFHFNYFLYENGIPAPFKAASISVNKYTGAVESFYWEGYSVKAENFPGLDGAIDLSAAKQAYLKEYGLKLQYNLNRDYQKKTITAIPVYVFQAGNGKAIDAITGAPVTLYEGYDGHFRYDTAEAEAAAEDGGGMNKGQLSAAELTEVEKTNGLLSQSEALAYVEKQAPVKNSGWKDAKEANLSREYYDQTKYRWEFYLDNVGYASVDAKTGELLSYNSYNHKEGTKSVSYEDAKKEVEAFLKSVARDSFGETKLNMEGQAETEYAKRIVENDNGYFDFQYIRQVNDTDVNGDGLSVTYDRKNGQIIYYGKSWNENVTFPSVENVMSPESAMERAAEISQFQMMYLLTAKNTPSPVYYSKVTPTIYLDPFTLDWINYDGTPYKKPGETEYSDLSGKWYETMVVQLLENGYYMEGAAFDGEAQISQEEFLRYLYSPIQSNYSDSESFYERMMRYDVIKEGEINPQAPLARQDAAKFIIRALGLEAAASHPEIYQNMFKDGVEEAYKGYAALSYGLGIFSGDGKGNFNGGKIMTKAEAAAVIYQYLNLK